MDLLKTIFTTISVAFLSSCSSQPEFFSPEVYPEGLELKLEEPTGAFEKADQVILKTTVTNKSTRSIRFYDHDLRVPHYLDVRDSHGQRVPVTPPPHPLTKKEARPFFRTLEPGDSYEIKYNMNILSGPPGRGTYTATHGVMKSNVIRFRILN